MKVSSKRRVKQECQERVSSKSVKKECQARAHRLDAEATARPAQGQELEREHEHLPDHPAPGYQPFRRRRCHVAGCQERVSSKSV